jgi:hypothetical protein
MAAASGGLATWLLPHVQESTMAETTRPDLVLMHPPAVFDFRERPLNHWLLSKAVDTNPVFE